MKRIDWEAVCEQADIRGDTNLTLSAYSYTLLIHYATLIATEQWLIVSDDADREAVKDATHAALDELLP